jgi:hypothetical protein
MPCHVQIGPRSERWSIPDLLELLKEAQLLPAVRTLKDRNSLDGIQKTNKNTSYGV